MVLIELIGGVYIGFDFSVMAMETHHCMQCLEQLSLLKQRQCLALEDRALGKWHFLQLPVVQEQNVGHYAEVHVLIHVGVLHQLAGCATTKEEARLQVNAISSKFIGCALLLVPLSISLKLVLCEQQFDGQFAFGVLML